MARAKAQLKASLVMNLESASSRADQIARQFLAFGQVPAISTLVAKIEAVTPEQVRDLADRLFTQAARRLQRRRPLVQLAGYDAIGRHFALRPHGLPALSLRRPTRRPCSGMAA